MRYLGFVPGLLLLAGCATTTSTQEPTQLAARQIEVRELEVPYDVAYGAATQAMFSLGYTIDHSDKTSGILTGSRMVGLKAAKEEARRKRTTGAVLGLIPYVGMLAPLTQLSPSTEPHSLQITMYLHAKGEKRTEIRFKMQVDGEPAWDPVTIDQLWVATQREAMIEAGPSPSSGSGQKGPAPQTPAAAAPQASPGSSEAVTPQPPVPPAEKPAP